MGTKYSQVRISTGLDATLPASSAAQKGRLKYSTDKQILYVDDGTNNVVIGGIGVLKPLQDFVDNAFIFDSTGEEITITEDADTITLMSADKANKNFAKIKEVLPGAFASFLALSNAVNPGLDKITCHITDANLYADRPTDFGSAVECYVDIYTADNTAASPTRAFSLRAVPAALGSAPLWDGTIIGGQVNWERITGKQDRVDISLAGKILSVNSTGVINAFDDTPLLMRRGILPSGTDLNTLTTPGIYTLTSTLMGTYINSPFTGITGATLTVRNGSTGGVATDNYITQECEAIVGDALNGSRIRQRTWGGSLAAWSNWDNVYVKPPTGIPQSDLDAATQAKLNLIAPSSSIGHTNFSVNRGVGTTNRGWVKIAECTGSMTQSTVRIFIMSAWSRMNNIEFVCPVQSQYSAGASLIQNSYATLIDRSVWRFSYDNHIKIMMVAKSASAVTEIWAYFDVANFATMWDCTVVANGQGQITPVFNSSSVFQPNPPGAADGYTLSTQIVQLNQSTANGDGSFQIIPWSFVAANVQP